MLERINAIIATYNSHEKFFKKVKLYFPPGSSDYQLVQRAYDEARKTCRDQKRDNGEPYFPHPRAVAAITMEYLRVRDPELIAAALTHDLPEDFRKEWSHEKMQSTFTARTAEVVWYVTKPPVEDFDGDREARNRFYHRKLLSAPREAQLVKLPDRLHNTMTLDSTAKSKQVRKVRETQDFYLPLAEMHTLLVHELEDAIRVVEASWKKVAEAV